MDNTVHLYRRRYIPDEMVELKDDSILYIDKDIIVTKWNVLKPRADIDHGLSVYYTQEGFKISKIYDAQGELVYWYCDIIETEKDLEHNSYIFHDLLIDILVYPDHHVEVVDLDEFADFTEQQFLPASLLAKALRRTNKLLNYIYEGKFPQLIIPITSRE
jgi:protein associated with RNAse G/E